MWLGEQRGYLMDWATQRWVQTTGRVVDLADAPWLDAPVGTTRGIASTFVEDTAAAEHVRIDESGDAGLLTDFSTLDAPDFDAAAADPRVVDFYANTSRFELDSWAEWN